MSEGRVIFCDFDGTITQEDVGNSLLNFCSRGKWDQIDQEFLEGNIGSEEAYQKIIPYIYESEEKIIKYIIENHNVDPDFISFTKKIGETKKDTLLILSDGFDIYIKLLLEKHNILNIPCYYANKWQFNAKGRIVFSFPYHNKKCQIIGGKCGNCKLIHLQKARKIALYKDRKFVYIGNGYSDRCPVKFADIILAKDMLASYCRDNNIEYKLFKNFTNVIDILY